MPSFLISFWPNSVSFPTFWLTKTVSFPSPRLSLTYLKFQCYIDSNFASLSHPNTKQRSQLWLDWPEVDRRAGWSDFPISPLPFFHHRCFLPCESGAETGGREHEHLPDWAGSRCCLMVAVAAVLLIVYALQKYGVDRRWLQHVPPVKAHRPPTPHCP